MTGYTDTIRRWATDTSRTGILPDADGTGEVGLASHEAGSRLAARFTLKVEAGRVTDARYQVFGCGFSMAACAVAAKMSVGCTLDDAQAIDAKHLSGQLEGLPEERGYCVELAIQALRAAIRSARGRHQPVQTRLPRETGQAPPGPAENPVYKALVGTLKPGEVMNEDRHLFACLLAVAVSERCDTAAALGLDDEEITAILSKYFPGIRRAFLERHAPTVQEPAPKCNEDVLSVLLAHVPVGPALADSRTAVQLAHILAARATRPGHLWVAMGLFERPQLTAAIRRHLPTLAGANDGNMRWKRFLYKQACERSGGMICKSPNCGVCSDYAICFAPE